ncbi:MAG: hypothetical protein LN413_00370 [Candidatus Thermoplasmatota archaeon]|nr:hypothetical protein [Candidatus Thermoplasmatota archaeon]
MKDDIPPSGEAIIAFDDKYRPRILALAGEDPTAESIEAAIRQVAEEDGLGPANLREVAIVAGEMTGDSWAKMMRGHHTPGQALFNRLVEELEGLIEFINPWHPRICALWVFQTYLVSVLPSVFYIGFTGPIGAAKTTVTLIVTDYSKNGLMAASLTESSLARSVGQGQTIGIDELDSLRRDIREVVETSLREGYIRGAYYMRSVRSKPNEIEKIDIFGPKAMNFREDVDEALKSRTYLIPMARVRDETMVDRVGDVLRYYLRRDRLPIKEELEAFCEEALAGWDTGRVDGFLLDDALRDRIRDLLMSNGGETSPRDAQLAFICFLIGEIVGIDILKEVQQAFEAQADYADEQIGAFCELVKEYWEGQEKPPFLYITALKDHINMVLRDKKERVYNHKTFRKQLRDIECREGVELKREPGVGRHIVYFTPELIASLYPSQAADFASLLSFSASQREANGVKEKMGAVKGREASVKHLIKMCEEICKGSPSHSFTLEALLHTEPRPEWLDRGFAEKWIKRWRDEGEIYEARFGEYRFIS